MIKAMFHKFMANRNLDDAIAELDKMKKYIDIEELDILEEARTKIASAKEKLAEISVDD